MCKNNYFNFGGIFLTSSLGTALAAQAAQAPNSELSRLRLCRQVAEAEQRSAALLWETRPGDSASAWRGDPREGGASSLCVHVYTGREGKGELYFNPLFVSPRLSPAYQNNLIS